MAELPEIDFDAYYPASSAPLEASGWNEPTHESIARIEALKVRLQVLAPPGDSRLAAVFHELDLLRASLLDIASRGATPPTPGAQDAPFPSPASRSLVTEGIIGQSDKIKKILKVLGCVAPTGLTVLLEGETGAGKELFARAIHFNSARKKFVAVNCGAFPSGIIESELFGHVKGAFTGAASDRKGKFEEADGGTIFLDEIGDLELPVQVKLLRVLEQGEVQRVGSEQYLRVDVRVIAATNKNLEKMVREERFREDLLYRLNVCPVFIPPLRERRDEIEILFEFFLEGAMGGRKERMPRLESRLRRFLFREYAYPGNIRELKNIANYVAMIWDGTTAVSLEDLPEKYRRKEGIVPPRGPGFEEEPSPPDLLAVREGAEREHLVRILQKCRGNVSRVCQEAGLSRSRVYQLFRKFALDPAVYRGRTMEPGG